ncbi:helix-turn-helix transcriptional regulator [Solwaraspora sp. WMMD1047]|uniref:helix-turn-helix domain-containing protein n=1 Tax=Solwaraspora sp. WMMD1047 TaxID=3016102 RepID=UPI002415F8D4|nr:helix-turn-helix transcriptional regulator [Solwaraspora sp. WMMD1047]MDG4830267.1 helix-turn-helix transcriptional regulator [Solwaraspora sp. WMMD1047]
MAGSDFLIRHLRRLRELIGLSQDAWAAKIHYSAQHVGGIERGERPVTPDYLAAVDQALGTSFVEYYEGHIRNEVTPIWLKSWFEHEREADLLRHFETVIVPGLLQTEAYARAIIGTELAGAAAEEAVMNRLARQAVITRNDSPARLVVTLDEGVLYRPVGGPTVMRPQLLALVEAIQRPNVSIYVVPSHVGAYAGLNGPLALASVQGRTVGLVDGHPEGGVVENPVGVTALERRWEAVREYAEPQHRSLELITKAAESWT